VTGVPPNAIGVDDLPSLYREVVVEQHGGSVDLQRGVHELAVGPRNSAQLNGIERLDVEVNRGGGAIDTQVWGQGGLHFNGHDVLLDG
jgi:hypothetical protein